MALINNNADEIFTLQSLHNQGIGSGGGGGGDIGNFISIGRDPNSFPGFYSIAMGENTVAAGEGSIAVGHNNKSIVGQGGILNGYNNIDCGYTYTSIGSAIFGDNNINFTGGNASGLIVGHNNYHFPLSLSSLTFGTNLFIGYWDNSSKILYADKDKTEIVEFTVPSGGVVILDYNPDVLDNGREAAQPKVWYSSNGINYNYVSFYDYGTFISGFNNKAYGFVSYGGSIVGKDNTVTCSANSGGTYIPYRDNYHIFGQGNNVDWKNASTTGIGLFISGCSNNIKETQGAILGKSNTTGNGYKANCFIMGNNNYITDSYSSSDWTYDFIIGLQNDTAIGNRFKISSTSTYGNFIMGMSNITGDGGFNYIYGNSNRRGINAYKLIKDGDDYYQIDFNYDNTSGTYTETRTIVRMFSLSNIYFYNNKFYLALSDRSGLDLDHPVSFRKYGSPTGYDSDGYIFGVNNTTNGSNGTITVGRNNKNYAYQGFIFGDSNTLGGGSSESTLLGNFNYGVGNYAYGFGQNLIVTGKYNNLFGVYNTTGSEESNGAIDPSFVKGTHTGATEISGGVYCQKTGQLYSSELTNTPTIDKELRTENAYDGLLINPVSNAVYSASYTMYNTNFYFKYNAITQRFELCFDPEYIDPQETGTVATTIHGINNGAFKGTANTIEGLNNYINHYKTIGCHLEGSSIVLNDNVYRFAAHAEGYNTYIGASYAHAEGYMTRASGEASHAGGNNTIAQGANQTAIGKFNIADTNNAYAFIIGNGAAEATRANALTVDWSGNLTIAGNLSMPNLTIVNRGDLTNKAYVDDYITDAYDDTETYDIGDYCIYNNTLYKCASAIAVAEPWTAAHWTATDIATELAAIKALAQQLPWTDFNQTLTAGQTTVTITDAAITATSAIDVYTNAFGVEPIDMVLTTGSVTLTFEAQTSDINVKVRVS